MTESNTTLPFTARRGSFLSNGLFGTVLVIALGVVLAFQIAQRRPAETPAALVNTVATLEGAIEQGASEGKPVLAFATATWCPPCQSLKRNGLADEGVQSLISERTVAITLEETTAEGKAAIARLPVQAFPTLLLIEDGSVRSTISGAQSADALQAWLEANTTATAEG